MSALLKTLNEAGVNLSIIGDQLSVKTKFDLTDEQISFIKVHKLELINALNIAANDQVSPEEIILNFLATTPFTKSMIEEGLRRDQQPFDQSDLDGIVNGELPFDTARDYLILWVRENPRRYRELRRLDKVAEVEGPLETQRCEIRSQITMGGFYSSRKNFDFPNDFDK